MEKRPHEHPFQAWADTLQDLGVMGLVRETLTLPALPALPVHVRPTEPSLHPVASRATSQPRPPLVQVPVTAALGSAYVIPDQPGARPSAETVAGAVNLADLEGCIQGCLACPLGPGRFRFVFGEGNPKARLMFIGEGPGKDEDQQGLPFVGKAGELLDKMIGAIGLTREQVYIANVVKCRPPDNRTPTSQEAQACLGYLRRQIELIDPAVIVTLGATPLRELLGVATGITKVRGTWQNLVAHRSIPVMPTFHPAYVLRQYTDDVRRAVWADLKAAKAWVDEHP